VQSLLLDVRKRDDLAPAFESATKARVDAIVVGQDALLQANRRLVTELAAEHRLPAIYRSREFIESGGLIAYGPNYPEFYRHAAIYVDKILRGARAGDLSIEQPSKFELVINRQTAKALGITIPQTLLLRVDEVIQ
jgi:putative tryptophan/tyrosine transport system substrate-binding protein